MTEITSLRFLSDIEGDIQPLLCTDADMLACTTLVWTEVSVSWAELSTE